MYTCVYNNYKLLHILINIKDTVFDNNNCFGQVIYKNACTLDDSHRTVTTEILQQLKVVPHHSEAYLLTIFFINTLFGPIFSFLCCLQYSLQHF